MRCRELRTLFGFKLPADLAQAFIAARGSAGAQDAFHEVRAADGGSTGSPSSCEFALPPVSTYRLTVEKTGFPLIPKTESR